MRLPFPFPAPRSRYGRHQGNSLFGYTSRGRGRSSGLKMRLILALVLALFAVMSYYGRPADINAVTGEPERVALVEESDEIQLGFQAAPEIVNQHGGQSQDLAKQQRVRDIGEEILAALDRDLAANDRSNPYRDSFRFTVLADRRTINAFALPGGPVFITEGLLDQLETSGQVAGVLGHEIGHILSRHGNKQMAKGGLIQGLASALGVLGGNVESMRMAQMVGAVVNMKYGREAELESDYWGVRLTTLAGYDPRAMIGVMRVLEAAGGGRGQPEFFSTHPDPGNRIAHIEEQIRKQLPQGVPVGLRP